MKEIFEKITHFFGFAIYRTKPKKKHKIKFNQKPILIEFVGVSGVGKSTLYHALKQQFNNYLEVNEFLKISKISRNDNFLDKNILYQTIAQVKLQEIYDLNNSPVDKLRIAHWNYSTLLEDALVFYNNKNYTLISEEGLFHNYSKSILELYNNDENKFQEIIKNRAIIYCYAEPEIIANQILKRKKETGKIVSQHKVDSLQELINLQKIALQEKQMLIDVLNENNVSLISIDTSESQQGNLELIIKFINDLQLKNTI